MSDLMLQYNLIVNGLIDLILSIVAIIAAALALPMIYSMIRKRNRAKYMILKKEAITYKGINLEYERVDDKFIQFLLDENESLSKKNISLKEKIIQLMVIEKSLIQEKKNLTFSFLLSTILTVIIIFSSFLLKRNKKKLKKTNLNTDNVYDVVFTEIKKE